MPMPGSQQMESLPLAYFLYSNRWVFRISLLLLSMAGLPSIFKEKKVLLPISVIAFTLVVVYLFNFKIIAEQMFKQPENLVFKSSSENKVNPEQIALAVEINGEVKAYPIEYIAYHHQVQDNVGGKSVIITYCNVCRSGRVFEPLVDGKPEYFRLVGMDHFNAMFEDQTTKTWWRQATGEAAVGPHKGKLLPEVASVQLSIRKIFELYPQAKIMQPDNFYTAKYDSLFLFEQGLKKSKLTGTDSISWSDKSWVVGIETGKHSKAYDWNRLKKERIINDVIADTPVVLVLSADEKSYFAFIRPSLDSNFKIGNDTLFLDTTNFDLSGRSLNDTIPSLKKINAYQEFWHSWKTFHPETEKY